jgi:2-methylisocitrate lyase-like PEP mutase family enzyme
LEHQGYPAVATASASIAESLGYEDGERIRLETMLEVLFRISRSIRVPVTADIEAGSADTVEALEENIMRVMETGVVGINLEDSIVEGGPLRSETEQCERIAAVREAASRHDLHLVVNARVDSLLSESLSSPEEGIEEAAHRAESYVRAGADCIYPIGPGDLETLSRLRRRITAPINIFSSPKALSLRDLHQLGINRVSFGPQVFRSCVRKFVNITAQLKVFGSYECFGDDSLTGKEISKFLISGKEPADR